MSHILKTKVDAVWLIFAGKETCIQHELYYRRVILGLSFRKFCLLPTELFLHDELDQFLHPGGFRVEANLCSTRQSGSGQKKR